MDEGRTRSGRVNFVPCDLRLSHVQVTPQNFSAGAYSTQKCVPFVKEISVRTAADGSSFLVLRSPCPTPVVEVLKGLHVLLRGLHTGCFFENFLPVAGNLKLSTHPLVPQPGTRSMVLCIDHLFLFQQPCISLSSHSSLRFLQ
jgi:hypothetical protein